MQAVPLNEFRRMRNAGEIALLTDDIRVMLLMAGTSVAEQDAGVTRIAHYTNLKEFDGTGYNRQALAGRGLYKHDSLKRIVFYADNPVFGNLAGGTALPAGMLVFQYVDGTAANDIPLIYLPFAEGEAPAPDGTGYTGQWAEVPWSPNGTGIFVDL